MTRITDPRTYEIMQDCEGFYLSTADGWDLTPTRRFQTYKDARDVLELWIAEHERAIQQEEDDHELWQRMAEERGDDEEDRRGDFR